MRFFDSRLPDPSADVLDRRRRDLLRRFRPQREWIDGRGLLIVAGHFMAGVGAGAWLLSIRFDYLLGQRLAILCVGISGLAHLAFLGRWERCWRILARPDRSWISRGMWGIVIFGLGGTGYLSPWTGAGVASLAFLAVSVLGATVVLVTAGFVYSVSRAIPFWHTPVLPVLYVAYGLRGGAALLLAAAALGGAGFDINAVETIKAWVLVSTMVLILFYLVAAGRSGGAATHSTRQLLAGRVSVAFYGGTVVLGIVVPLVLLIIRELGFAGMLVLGLIAAASLMGDFYVKYCISKAGAYAPLTDPLARPSSPDAAVG